MLLSEIDFKTDRVRSEWKDPKAIDPKLRVVILWAAWWVANVTGSILVLTCLLRTEEENKKAGGHPLSAHRCGRGVDIRIWGWTDEDRTLFIAAASRLFGKWLSILDEGDHIHIGIKYEYRSEGYEI